MNDTELFALARQAKENAYAPYSGFSVGAAILAVDGNVYSGCNVENSSYPCSACAEKGAVSAMIRGGSLKITKIAVVGSGEDFCYPCGNCRQTIFEFSDENTEIMVADSKGNQRTHKCAELLKHGFRL